MEIILSHLPRGAEAAVLAESELHLASLLARSPSRTAILAVRTQTPEERARAAFTLARTWIEKRPDAGLVNTYDSACLLSSARRILPAIDRNAFLYVRDFCWPGIARLLTSLPGAKVIVPHEVVLEREKHLTPDLLAGRSIHVIQDMVEIPFSAGPHTTGAGPVLHLATVNSWKGHLHIVDALVELRRRGSSIALIVASLSRNGGPETFGRTIIEAWSHCRPIVAFAAGAPGRLIRHGIDGILVPEGDTIAMTGSLQTLHANPNLQRKLGEAGYQRVRRSYAAPAVVSRLFEILFPKRAAQPALTA